MFVCVWRGWGDWVGYRVVFNWTQMAKSGGLVFCGFFAKANNFSKIWLLYPSAHASLSSPLLYEFNYIILFLERFLFWANVL